MRGPDAGVAWLSSHPLKSRGLNCVSPAGGLVLGCLLQSWISNRPVWCGMSYMLARKTEHQYTSTGSEKLYYSQPSLLTEQFLGSLDKRITEHTVDLNHTICNQKYRIFAAVDFWNFWKWYVFSNPVSSQYLHSYISSTVTNFSLQFVLKSLLVRFPLVMSSSELVPFEVLHLVISLCEIERRP